jgi:hypothetical protein
MEKINFLPYFILGNNIENPDTLLGRVYFGRSLIKGLLYTGSDLHVLRVLE